MATAARSSPGSRWGWTQGAVTVPAPAQSPVGNMSNRAPDGFHFEEKGGKDFKQQLKLLRKKKKKEKENKQNKKKNQNRTKLMHYGGGHHLGNMPDRLYGCRKGQGEMRRNIVEI